MFNQILPTSNIRNIWRTVRRIFIWILGLKGSSVNIVVRDWYQLANLFVNSCCDTCKLVIVTRAPSQAKPGFYELVLAEARGT